MDRLVVDIFASADYRLVIDYQHMVYFQTFNIVLFVALILAERRFIVVGENWLDNGGVTYAGIRAHLLFRIGNVLLTAFAWQPALQLTTFPDRHRRIPVAGPSLVHGQ